MCLAHHGWAGFIFHNKSKKVKKSGSDPELHVTVRVGPDPRFVFQFDGEPECSPQVFLVKGNDKQAVFTSKFRFRNPGDRNLSRSVIFNLTVFIHIQFRSVFSGSNQFGRWGGARGFSSSSGGFKHVCL